MDKSLKNLSKCKHPHSRKAKALTKQTKKLISRNKGALTQNLKWTVTGTKIQWFIEHLPSHIVVCSPEQTKELIESYLIRFNEELEQITLKHSIGNRKNRQHASREDIIKMTIKRETEEYNTCGLEIPNVMDPHEMLLLRTWNGDLVALQHMKLIRLSKKKLDSLIPNNV
ncbi:hypothetical protein ILUMI_00239 [Ignelater luminosus]|uniref:Translation machinery-associated protein 16 n=1 Tax=Ignelater luminosus TaxID=2038154 RepID=A0A8K0DT10_IGNLU|nr:hypothetical protein ILUMI_00239 [Ignelater luminosus]